MFLCSYDTVKAGDLIVSPMYTTPMQVIGVSNYSAREQNSKPYAQVQVGDIVKLNNSFLKVLRKNDNGTLQCLSFSGYSSNRREIKDFMLGQALVRVVVNMFSGMTTGGFNPMMLMMMDKGGDNSMLETMMMMQMMGGQNPMMGFMNPASTEKK